MAVFRYLVDDVSRAVEFYVGLLGFELAERRGEAFAQVRRGDLELWLSGQGSSAARRMPDGTAPRPGGWNRIVLEVPDLAAEFARLEAAGAKFRSGTVSGPGGTQLLVEDGAGNVVELFEAKR